MRNTVSSTAAHSAETYVPTPSPSIARSIPWTTDTPSSFSPNHMEHFASLASLSAHARQLSCLKSGDSRQSRLLVTRFDFSKYLGLLIQVLMLFSAFDPPEPKRPAGEKCSWIMHLSGPCNSGQQVAYLLFQPQKVGGNLKTVESQKDFCVKIDWHSRRTMVL